MAVPHPWNSRPSSIRLIAMVASAGGLNAFKTVLSQLPSGFSAPILVCQHRFRRETQDDVLLAILKRSCALEVIAAETGIRPENGTVYVAPPGRNLLVSKGRLCLSDIFMRNGARPSANALFESLASEFGAKAMVVVLSGALSDGALGVVKVKASGGRVIVQQPETAQSRGMPNAAIESGCADFILPLNRIASALTTFTMVPGSTDLFTPFSPAWALRRPSAN